MVKIKNKKIYLIPFFIFFISFVFVPSFSRGGNMERKIIVFKDGVSENEKENLIRKHGGEKIKDLKSIKGKAVYMSRGEEKELGKEDKILRIDDDVIVEAADNIKNYDNYEGAAGNGGSENLDSNADILRQPPQVLPWGISRISAPLVWNAATADTVKVAVIDTGIALGHADLKINIKGSYNTIKPGKTAWDDNGHGTHVAGVIAAANNKIGVVGIANKADIYAVKALNSNGSGYLSDVIEGIDWAIQNKIQVINMSLGVRSDVLSFHEAIKRAYDANIIVVAAAGNNQLGNVNFPAAYPEVIAVSAIDQNDQIAPFSSVGPEVDFAAPGVNIFSTFKGSAYATLNGTSMASPHVAGTAALILSVPSKCDADLDGKCSPSEVYSRLAATAEDLGNTGFDNFYGNGLINAGEAVTR